MNFAKSIYWGGLVLKNKAILKSLLALLLSVYIFGCSDYVHLPSDEQLASFESAGPSGPTVDIERIVKAKIELGPYRIVPGDVLELSMPIVLQVIVTQVPDFPDKIAPYQCRVRDDSTISLPMVGEIRAAGRTCSEIESAIVDAYYPTYTRTQPAVVARVAEYKTHKVSITGAVQKPGLYELRSDQMSLVALLMQAGGIIEEGATRIRITHATQANAGIDKQANYTSYQSRQGRALTDRHATKYTAQATINERPRSVSNYLASSEADGIDVQMTFQQVSRTSTTGRLIIKHEQTILLDEQLDITNEIQRWTILNKIAGLDQRVATTEVGRIWARLSELAELLKPGAGAGNNANTIVSPNLISSTETNLNDTKQITKIDDNLEKISENTKVIKPYQTAEKTEVTEQHKVDRDTTFVLPVRGLNIPFTDVALQEGDTVIVERLEMSLFTVIGLVNKPGNFPYPPDVQYNLVQAIAFAGGLDQAAEPRYATVYRLNKDGSIVRTPFQIIRTKNGSQLTDALNIPIKPGDIIAVEDTPRTRTNAFLKRIFYFNFGAYLPVTELLK
ncbi:MAG: SLBB domain-containing protein [Dehalococcoidia bacterium]|nr:SLBB domain-containing protein [Dehalococcoidia bacterium]